MDLMLARLRVAREKAGDVSIGEPAYEGRPVEVEWDVEGLLQAWHPLRLDPEFVLRLFVRQDGGNAVSWLFAVPKALAKEPLEGSSREVKAGVVFEGPRPPGALEDFMLAIRGDGSDLSYLLASFMSRDGQELGARWHGVHWGCHHLLYESLFVPPETADRELDDEDEDPSSKPEYWTWSGEPPQLWAPSVTKTGADSIQVRFLTRSRHGIESIFEHRDTYSVGSYLARAEEQRIGQGAMGYVH